MYQYGKAGGSGDFQPGDNQNTIYSNPNNLANRVLFKQGEIDFLNAVEEEKFFSFINEKISGESEVYLNGYASEEGEAGKNLDLSKRRAVAIQNIIQGWYPNIQVHVVANGEIVGNKEYNRAVQINVINPVAEYTWDPANESVKTSEDELPAGHYSGRTTGEVEKEDKSKGQDVVVYLSGLRAVGINDGDNQHGQYVDDNIDIIQQVQNGYDSSKNTLAATAFVSGWMDAITKIALKRYINKHWRKGGKLILVGYSWGGDTLLELADELSANVVDLMVTIDPADGLFTPEYWTPYKRPVGPGTRRIINYYQPHTQGGTGSGRRKLPGDPPRVQNFKIDEPYKGEEISHSNIDEAVKDRVAQDVLFELRNGN
jgi:hypothetical protein